MTEGNFPGKEWTKQLLLYLLTADVKANFRVAILLHCQTLFWRNATFQTRQNRVKRVITDVTTLLLVAFIYVCFHKKLPLWLLRYEYLYRSV